MKRPHKDYLHPVADDGLRVAEVNAWTEDKYRHFGMYADIFSTGMKNLWDQRVYLDLFAGPGHTVFKENRRRVLGSPLIALRVPHPFDKYIFCEENPDKLESLRHRANLMAPTANIEFVHGDANSKADELATLIPPYSRDNKVLAFCFVDPFDIGIHFETIRVLSSGRSMDFLILLALAMDANRNIDTYRKPGNRKMDRFLGDSAWRPRWVEAENRGTSPIRFLAEEYAAAMSRIGYPFGGLDRVLPVRTRENNMLLYYLAFFSRHAKGYKFWDEVRTYSTDQTNLFSM